MAAALQAKLHSEQRFTADVAHELRTPLTGLHLAAELLPSGRPAEMVQDRIRAMSRLTDDLLAISRLDLEISHLDEKAERADAEVQQLGPPTGAGSSACWGTSSPTPTSTAGRRSS